MSHLPFLRLAAFFILVVVVLSAPAQDRRTIEAPSPRLLAVTPAGGQQGTSFEVTLAGQSLEEPQELIFSIPGAKAEYLAPTAAPMIEPQRGRQQRGMAAGPLTAVKFKLTLPEKAPLGIHDIRVVTKAGISNPRAFVVGDSAQIVEKEPNDDVAQAQKVELDTTICGALGSPTDVDYFLFAGKKGQRVVVACLTTSIDSRAQPDVHLYRAGGAPLASGRDYEGGDAVLDATLPANDNYYVRVSSFTYTQGGPDHFYRLSISTAPWIDAVYPPMIEPGKSNEVTVYGRNLPGGSIDPDAKLDGHPLEKVTVKVKGPSKAQTLQRLRYHGFIPPRSAALDGMEYRIANDTGKSNPYLLTYAQAPIVLDNEENDSAEKAQEITLPCEIAGRIEKRHDRDWYKFTAKAGEVYMIEALADRIGSPLDLVFTLGKEGTKNAAEYDDDPELLHPLQFFNRSEDPAPLRWTAPADGTYLLQVTSREADIQAGPRHLYRVRITPPKPDFRLIVMPASTNAPEAALVPREGAQIFTVLAWRRDGFNGPIKLSMTGLPDGVACPDQTMGPGLKQTALVVTARADAEPWTGMITVTGTADIDGEEIIREARPASITWPAPQQQNVPVISRLDRGLALAVRDGGPHKLSPGQTTLTVAPGAKATLPIKLTRGPDFKVPVQVTLLGYANNFIALNNSQPLTIPADKDTANAVFDVRRTVPPGSYTLVLRGAATVQLKDVAGKPRGNANILVPATPVTLVVATPKLGEVTVNVDKATWKPGMTTDVVVKVKRQQGISGPLRVQLILPEGMTGFSAGEMSIPERADTVKLPIRASSRAAPGRYQGLIVRVSARSGDPAPSADATFTATVK